MTIAKGKLAHHMKMGRDANHDDPNAFGIGKRGSFERRVIFKTLTPDGRVVSYHVTKGWRAVHP